MSQTKLEQSSATEKEDIGHFMSAKGNGVLRLYNAFPRNYSTLAEATADLVRIGALGFNAVWINPINVTSNVIVRRYNVVTSEEQEVKGSLYGTYDYSTLNWRLFSDLPEPMGLSDGNPGRSSAIEREKLLAYTDTARANGMQPIFDLVLNHVACDSPLISGGFSYFANDRKVNTTQWFQERDPKWDDVVLFKYDDPEIREKIIKELWIPYLKKYIDDFGFMGARIDFAGAACRPGMREVEKALVSEITRLVENKYGVSPIIYAELLPPGAKLEKNVRSLRELYTHVTNSTLWNPEKCQHEMGMKQQATHLMLDGTPRPIPRGGTVGFAASHDDGPNARGAFHDFAKEIIEQDPYKRHIYYESSGKKREHELDRTLTELLAIARKDEAIMAKCIFEQKKRLALCAIVSDGGMCLLGGDEFGRLTPASVFEKANGETMYNDMQAIEEAKARPASNHCSIIKNLNAALADMPRPIFPHWYQVLHLDAPYNDLVIVMNYNGEGFTDPQPVLSIVNITATPLQVTDELMAKIAEKQQQMHPNNPDAQAAISNSRQQLIGPFNVEKISFHPKLYNQIDTYQPEEPTSDMTTIAEEAEIWEPDREHDEIRIVKNLNLVAGNLTRFGIWGQQHQKDVTRPMPLVQIQLYEVVSKNEASIRAGNLSKTIKELKELYRPYRQIANPPEGVDTIKHLIEGLHNSEEDVQENLLAILDKSLSANRSGPISCS